MNEIKIANVIIKKRREKGITQEELAEHMSVSKAAVSKWEKEQSYPDITLLPRLAAYFNISVDELLCYCPRLTREDIWKLCKKLSADFSSKPCAEVLSECGNIIKKYYSCFPLLYHVALLYVNHHTFITEKEKQRKLLAEAKTLCRRIVSESGDALLAKDALYLQSLCALLLETPAEVFELLGETVSERGDLSESYLISQAFDLAGNTEKAIKISQCGMYGHLMQLINSLISHISLSANGFEAAEAAFHRAIELVRLFNLKELDMNTTAKVYVVGAIIYCKDKRLEKSLEWLEAYADLCVGVSFPIEFKGDFFFTDIGEWLASDFYSVLPYDTKMLKRNMLASLTAIPEFTTALQNEPRYKKVVKKLTAFTEI